VEIDQFLATLRDALASITESRVYESERGYQGQLLIEISSRLKNLPVWPGAPFVEQEYQKNADVHGLRIRPDIIIHQPFDRGNVRSRKEGNYVVFELKLRATEKEALHDFGKLSDMCTVLEYQLGVFINIDATNTYLAQYNGPMRDRLRAFAVRLNNGTVELHEE
jgi:hypothetical protein